MKHFLLPFIVILIFLPALRVSAQEGGDLQCPDTDLAAALQSAIDTLTAAQGQDAAAQYVALVEVRTTLATVDGACLGLDFGGDANTATDPVYIPAGLYRATLTADADANIDVDMIILDGACYPAGQEWETALFDFVGGGSQVMLTSEGCTLIWQTEYVHGPYTVTFEKLK